METTIQIGNNIFSGWTAVAVNHRLDAISGSFSVSLVDNWSSEAVSWPFRPGMECVVRLGSVPVITGYLDTVSTGFSVDERSIELTGRDKAGDLVDCAAAVDEKDEFLKQSISQIATKLCEPFKVKVIDQAGDQSKFDNWKIDPGESVFESLERATRKRGLLLRSNGLGDLVITQLGTKQADSPLLERVNIKTAMADYDQSGTFSDYIVRGQSKDMPGGGVDVTEVEARSKDQGIARYRPYLVLAESDVDKADAQKRANWEAAVRAARSVKVSITTQGWTQESGRLWAVNELVFVQSPRLGIQGYLLVVGVDFTYDESGTLTTLELSRPDAFLAEPAIKKSKLDEDETDPDEAA